MSNRIIKFRAWDLHNERMIMDPYRFEPWAEYHSFKELNPTFVCSETWQDEEDGIRRPCHIMQFTGLLDKAGNEIYEGDIVKVGLKPSENKKEYITQVIYSQFRAQFALEFSHFANNDLYRYVQNENVTEVIGNIYSSPELIEK